MICRVCKSETQQVFRGTVMNKYDVGYFLCPVCDFLQTQDPYWLDESYANPMNLTDTGTVRRCTIMSKSAATLLYFSFDQSAKFLDYAGGYGIYTRMMRDIGFDYYTTDPYTPNMLARGFDTVPDKIELVSAFECFEHFVDPVKEISKILAFSPTIFFSTQPHPSPVPALTDWWYYSPHHGQHVAFYSKKTFRYIASQLELNYYSLLNYHLLTPKKMFAPWYMFLVASGRLGLVNLVKLLMKSRIESDQLLLKKMPQEMQ